MKIENPIARFSAAAVILVCVIGITFYSNQLTEITTPLVSSVLSMAATYLFIAQRKKPE